MFESFEEEGIFKFVAKAKKNPNSRIEPTRKKYWIEYESNTYLNIIEMI